MKRIINNNLSVILFFGISAIGASIILKLINWMGPIFYNPFIGGSIFIIMGCISASIFVRALSLFSKKG